MGFVFIQGLIVSLFLKMETFVYKNFIVPLQGKHTFDFVSEHYQKGNRVLDFGCGIGSNSKLFESEDYIGVEVDESRVGSARLKYPESQFEQIPFISSKDDKMPFDDNSFDIILFEVSLIILAGKTILGVPASNKVP